MKIDKKIVALLASYGRSVLAGALSLYIAGVTDPKALASALIAALLPVLIRWINPNDPAFGRVPTAVEVDEAIKTAKPVAAKKATPKK